MEGCTSSHRQFIVLLPFPFYSSSIISAAPSDRCCCSCFGWLLLLTLRLSSYRIATAAVCKVVLSLSPKRRNLRSNSVAVPCSLLSPRSKFGGRRHLSGNGRRGMEPPVPRDSLSPAATPPPPPCWPGEGGGGVGGAAAERARGDGAG